MYNFYKDDSTGGNMTTKRSFPLTNKLWNLCFFLTEESQMPFTWKIPLNTEEYLLDDLSV